MKNKFKAEQFLKDIGLDLHLTMLKEERPSNIKEFKTPHSILMDTPEAATYTHLMNLINTYGKELVFRMIEECK